MNTNEELFENVPVPKALATLAIPTIISQLITMVYNLADTFFVGKTGDPYKIAASSLVYVLFFALTALSNLFGVGGGSLISRLLGEGKTEEARKVASLSIYGTVIIAALYATACFAFMKPLMFLLGASEATLKYAASYTFWVVVVGAIPSMLNLTFAHILRCIGYSKKASAGLSGGGLLNMALDPFFMFVVFKPGQEVAAAAFATMLSNVVVLIYFAFVFLMLKDKTVLNIKLAMASEGTGYIGEVLLVGLPSFLSSLLNCISNVVVNKQCALYGDVPVAAMGIVKKIDMLPLNFGMGLCQGMIPLIAYNYGAHNYKRMKKVTDFSRLCALCFAALCVMSFELLAPGLIKLFIDEQETVFYGTAFLRICCLATPLMVINFQMVYTLQAMGKGIPSLILAVCRQGLLNIPAVYIMNYFFGLKGIAMAQIAADALTMLIAFGIYGRVYRKLN